MIAPCIFKPPRRTTIMPLDKVQLVLTYEYEIGEVFTFIRKRDDGLCEVKTEHGHIRTYPLTSLWAPRHLNHE